jgi:hypothetical protein
MAGGTRAPLFPEPCLLPGWNHRIAPVTPVVGASPEMAGGAGTSAGTGGTPLSSAGGRRWSTGAGPLLLKEQAAGGPAQLQLPPRGPAAPRLQWPDLARTSPLAQCCSLVFFQKIARDPEVILFLTDRSLAVQPSYLFARNSDSGETSGHLFVSSSPSRWCHSHAVLT